MAIFRGLLVKVCERLLVFLLLLAKFLLLLTGRFPAVCESIYGGTESEDKTYPVRELHRGHRLSPSLLHRVVHLKAVCKILYGVYERSKEKADGRENHADELHSSVEQGRGFGGESCPCGIYKHYHIVGGDGGDTCDNLAAVLDEEIHHSRQCFERDSRRRNYKPHHRLQFLTEFHGQSVDAVLRLVELRLNGVVLHLELLVDGCSLLEGFIGDKLLTLDLVDMVGERRECGYGTRAVLAHVFEHRREDIHVAGTFEGRKKLDQGGIHIGFYEIGEFLHVHAGDTGILGRVLINPHNNLRESR